MTKQSIPGVVFQPHTHRGMQRGIEQVVAAVRPTLGPTSRLVAVEPVFRHNTPELLDDAATIARRLIQLPDRQADAGAMLLRHLLWRVHEEAGDGAATAAVLFHAVYSRGAQYVAAGGNAMELRRQLERGMQEILDELDGATLQIAGRRQLTQLAESLCSDQALATMLGEVLDMVGEHGHVGIRTGHRDELERQYTEGWYWASGALSPHMLADQVRLRVDLVDTAILLSDLDIEDPRQLMPLLDAAAEQQARSLLVVAAKLSDSAIALLLAASRSLEQFRAIAVRTPGTGLAEQAAALEDLAVLTGGRPLLKAAGDSLRGLRPGDLGRARRTWADKTHLGVVGGKGDRRTLRRHLAGLQAALGRAEEPQRRSSLRERIGKLMGGTSTVVVGGRAESEIKLREERARKVVKLLRAALHAGVLPGGGVALLACRARLQRSLAAAVSVDEQAAYRILLRAVEEPLRTIALNAGYDDAEVLGQLKAAGARCGFDVRSGQAVDVAAAGIFDVATAQKTAVRAAISGAATALTIDTLVQKRHPEQVAGRP